MASLSYLQPYLADTQAKAIELDVSSPVVDTLLTLLQGVYPHLYLWNPRLRADSHVFLQNSTYLAPLIIPSVHSTSSLPL